MKVIRLQKHTGLHPSLQAWGTQKARGLGESVGVGLRPGRPVSRRPDQAPPRDTQCLKQLGRAGAQVTPPHTLLSLSGWRAPGNVLLRFYQK